MFATGLEIHQIVEVTNANFLALLQSGRLFLMRSKHCDYSVVTMSIIGPREGSKLFCSVANIMQSPVL